MEDHKQYLIKVDAQGRVPQGYSLSWYRQARLGLIAIADRYDEWHDGARRTIIDTDVPILKSTHTYLSLDRADHRSYGPATIYIAHDALRDLGYTEFSELRGEDGDLVEASEHDMRYKAAQSLTEDHKQSVAQYRDANIWPDYGSRP